MGLTYPLQFHAHLYQICLPSQDSTDSNAGILTDSIPKVHFFKECTWQNRFIQKFAKTALSIRCCVGGGPFLQFFG